MWMRAYLNRCSVFVLIGNCFRNVRSVVFKITVMIKNGLEEVCMCISITFPFLFIQLVASSELRLNVKNICIIVSFGTYCCLLVSFQLIAFDKLIRRREPKNRNIIETKTRYSNGTSKKNWNDCCDKALLFECGLRNFVL